MANEEIRIWGIHTTDEALFLHDNIIAIGWKEFGDCSKLEPTREAYKNHYIASYPNGKKGAVATSAGMLYRFVHEMKAGDYVVFPSKSDRKINIGLVESDFIYNPTADLYVQQRKVKWLKHLPRTAFSQGALYELGSAMSFFLIKNYADEYLQALDKGFKPAAAMNEPDETVAATAEDIIESTRDFILKELSKKLKGYALEEFVADLLRAMGYRCTVSPQGGDSGIDITAYKDELPPRILVQVKSQDSDIKETTIQSLKGAINCTPFVRQYDILSNKWGVHYAKRSTKQTIYARVQENGRRNHGKRASECPFSNEGIRNQRPQNHRALGTNLFGGRARRLGD